ncbi:hypothetical protein HanIR_Chr02g0087161 [Helianthus annuus]|nr:hypothetical protein HanIR_Chr02g0087161 [Helianthus annuus]
MNLDINYKPFALKSSNRIFYYRTELSFIWKLYQTESLSELVFSGILLAGVLYFANNIRNQ